MLTEEFSNASRIVTSYQRSVGEPALVAALQSFADDWRVHRQSLLSEAVYTMASRSHTAYIVRRRQTGA